MASIAAIFTSRYHAKQLNPWLNSSAIVDGVVNYNWLTACQGEMESFKKAFMDIRQSSKRGLSKRKSFNFLLYYTMYRW